MKVNLNKKSKKDVATEYFTDHWLNPDADYNEVNIDNWKVSHEDFIGIYENALHPDVCEKIIQHFEELLSLQDSYQLKYIQPRKDSSIIKKDLALDVQIPVMREMLGNTGQAVRTMLCTGADPVFNKVIYKTLRDAFFMYRDAYDTMAHLPLMPIYNKVQKTEIGEGFHAWHSERDGGTYNSRYLAYTIYLNDVEEGGETEFLYQHKRLKSNTGTICIFPANFTHTHRGNPPLSNTKYIMTGWFDFVGRNEEL